MVELNSALVTLLILADPLSYLSLSWVICANKISQTNITNKKQICLHSIKTLSSSQRSQLMTQSDIQEKKIMLANGNWSTLKGPENDDCTYVTPIVVTSSG